ncbi:hypothetical protein SAMN05216228_101368 [Rhizobium tibeticum]|uniref:Uncharacterized protein n=1 Tax=Rhizobium tibeticum TaxID=501024 RepID=A0A1H8MTX0_9HYPH|nr:hypothetical protein RTCCBAU85039_4674 [Rhizobium tibeticum]SEO20911.1 hypothetical protein SAMN05216228_101368 [Rhizobium tibeticum]
MSTPAIALKSLRKDEVAASAAYPVALKSFKARRLGYMVEKRSRNTARFLECSQDLDSTNSHFNSPRFFSSPRRRKIASSS